MKRYVVTLDGYGRLFLQSLRNYGIDDLVKDDMTNQTAVQHVFGEVINQIFLQYDGTPEIFLGRLQNLPHHGNFRNVPSFNDKNIVHDFSLKSREFGFALYTQMKRYVPMNPDVDYLLEAYNPDYIVILETVTSTDATEYF